MKDCEDNAFDLAIVDPPYGIGASKGTRVINKNLTWKGARDRNPLEKKEWDNAIPKEEYFNELFSIQTI